MSSPASDAGALTPPVGTAPALALGPTFRGARAAVRAFTAAAIAAAGLRCFSPRVGPALAAFRTGVARVDAAVERVLATELTLAPDTRRVRSSAGEAAAARVPAGTRGTRRAGVPVVLAVLPVVVVVIVVVVVCGLSVLSVLAADVRRERVPAVLGAGAPEPALAVRKLSAVPDALDTGLVAEPESERVDT